MDSLHILSLGCARNDVDSEELAARFSADGFSLVENPEDADVIVANTCGFIEAAKAESIDEILSMAELKNHGKVRKVIAAGCMATRYGQELASSLVEADAVIGFDGYPDIAHTVRQLLAGTPIESHTPTDRRHKGIKSLPLTVTQPEIPV
ncbi:MAG: MiaB/RimO family radical SAM methylthiotransferase, partial [Propionibacteriaceae bacterium]|nr:MiaB/RimO family radical SAM methylthiotransferase [Propionibacteriaceae bacterium]